MDELNELQLLQQFFTQWERLHALRGMPELQQEAAQQLVETAHLIRELQKDGTQNVL